MAVQSYAVTQDRKSPCCQATWDVCRRADANQDIESRGSPRHMHIWVESKFTMQMHNLFTEQMQHLFLKSWWVALTTMRGFENNINTLADGNTLMTVKLLVRIKSDDDREGC